jgi:hypothetical protein
LANSRLLKKILASKAIFFLLMEKNHSPQAARWQTGNGANFSQDGSANKASVAGARPG